MHLAVAPKRDSIFLACPKSATVSRYIAIFNYPPTIAMDLTVAPTRASGLLAFSHSSSHWQTRVPNGLPGIAPHVAITSKREMGQNRARAGVRFVRTPGSWTGHTTSLAVAPTRASGLLPFPHSSRHWQTRVSEGFSTSASKVGV